MEMWTIFALATPPGRGGIAVFRISGPNAGESLRRLTNREIPRPREVTRRIFRDPGNDDPIDDGVAIWYPAPRSYTGEDVVELQVHGGPAVTAGVMAALSGLQGLRLAEPGEFTRRAFENGKLDLTAAEGIADLVAAESAAQRRQALAQTRGRLGALYEGWRADLVRALAHIEAWIDFPEEPIPDSVSDEIDHKINVLIRDISTHLDDGGRGERLRRGLSVAILGAPNAGKSSLLNVLARRDAAIVSEAEGTTRDVIEVHLDIGGYPVMVADTAGLRDSAEAVEQEGVRRALDRAESADLRLVLFDVTVERDAASLALVDEAAIVVANKVDLRSPGAASADGIEVSAATGEGIDALIAEIGRFAVQRLGESEEPALTRARHRAALEECVAALRRAHAVGEVELRAEDLRLAMRALGRITGRIDVEDLLDVIFRDFCIGK